MIPLTKVFIPLSKILQIVDIGITPIMLYMNQIKIQQKKGRKSHEIGINSSSSLPYTAQNSSVPLQTFTHFIFHKIHILSPFVLLHSNLYDFIHHHLLFPLTPLNIMFNHPSYTILSIQPSKLPPIQQPYQQHSNSFVSPSP